jgi:hypothetical protein
LQKWIAGDDDFEAAEKRPKEAVVRRPKIVEVAEAVGHGWLQQNGNLD